MMMKANILLAGQTKTEVEFTDISSELWRIYEFPGGDKVEIRNPKWLYVSPSGGHRLIDESGKSHYVTSKWIHIYWQVSEGQSFFVA